VDVIRDTVDMTTLLRGADLAITAGGSTCWELCLLGVPMVVLTIADNQRRLAAALADAGAATFAPTPSLAVEAVNVLMTSAVRRKEMKQCGRLLVDGCGAGRVVSVLQGEDLFMRPVREDDSRRVWEWANDKDVRDASFNSDPIPWETHTRWFDGRRNDPRVTMWIVEMGGAPVGVIRFEPLDVEGLVSVTLDKNVRGQGWGPKIISLATRRFLQSANSPVVHAFIKKRNVRSKIAFERAGYKLAGEKIVGGESAWHLTWGSNESR
jgi:RimJ/RimL family protein N-acetyltransferase